MIRKRVRFLQTGNVLLHCFLLLFLSWYDKFATLFQYFFMYRIGLWKCQSPFFLVPYVFGCCLAENAYIDLSKRCKLSDLYLCALNLVVFNDSQIST